MEDYAAKSVTELRQIARSRGIRGVSSLRKNDLVARLESEDRMAAKAAAAARISSDDLDQNKAGDASMSAPKSPESAAAAAKRTAVEPSGNAEGSRNKEEMVPPENAAEAGTPETVPSEASSRSKQPGGAQKKDIQESDGQENNDRTGGGREDNGLAGAEGSGDVLQSDVSGNRPVAGTNHRNPRYSSGRTAGGRLNDQGDEDRAENARRQPRTREGRAENARRQNRNGAEHGESMRRQPRSGEDRAENTRRQPRNGDGRAENVRRTGQSAEGRAENSRRTARGGDSRGDVRRMDQSGENRAEGYRMDRSGNGRAESVRRAERGSENRAENIRRNEMRQNDHGMAESRPYDSRRGRRNDADSRREMNDRRGMRGRDMDRRDPEWRETDGRDMDRRSRDDSETEDRRSLRNRESDWREADRRDFDARNSEDRRGMHGRDMDDRRLARETDEPQRMTQEDRERFQGWNTGTRNDGSATVEELRSLDSGDQAHGILEVMPEGYGFIRSENYLPGEDDVYVSPSQIRRFNMKTGDVITGSIRVKTGSEKFAALLYVSRINGDDPSVAEHRRSFEDLTPVFPHERIHLETPGGSKSTRIVDLMSPIGKGQRGMIVSPPKAGKTTLLKEIAKAVQINHPEMHIIILLIDERPEEVTDMRESIQGDNVEVIYSTFDEMPEHHKRVSEMVLGRAKRLVEHGRDVIILLDSITRLARACNLTVAPSGRTLSGGLDPAALYMPKKFFGAARCMREGGSLTILATALVDTGSRMDDVVFEEFKGTGNMELVLDRKLSERRIFPAVDMLKSGTRREDLLLTPEEREATAVIRRAMNGVRTEDAVEEVIRLFDRTSSNREFIQLAKKIRI